MDNEVEKFDPSKLMQGVKDRIKATFISLIPDDRWEEMVKVEVDDFLKEKDRGHNSREYQSDFQGLVKTLLKDEVKKRVSEYFSGEEFQTIWTDNGLPKVSTAVEEMMVKNAGAILTNFIGGIMQVEIDRFRAALQHKSY